MCRGRVRFVRVVLVGVESPDVLNEGHDAARKDEDEGDYAQGSDDVQSDEDVWSGRLATGFQQGENGVSTHKLVVEAWRWVAREMKGSVNEEKKSTRLGAAGDRSTSGNEGQY